MELGLTLALGALVGLTTALTGAGGAILAVPLLVFGLHLTLPQAAPIALLTVGLVAAIGALLGLREGLVRYRAAALMGVVGIAGAPLGLWMAARLPHAPLTLGFAALLLWIAHRQWRGPQAVSNASRTPACQRDARDGRFIWTRPCARALAGNGLLAGVASGLLGVGGGFILIPALSRHTDLDARSRILTTQAVTALIGLSGAALSLPHGRLNTDLALPFAAGAVAALLVGRRWAQALAGPTLQRCFALLCVLVAIGLTLRTLT